MPSAAKKRSLFKQLHESGCFVMPNPWDIGSLKYLQSLGFPALATTSAGFAFSQGAPDGGVSRAQVLAHMGAMAAAADVPMNADFEAGFADTPEGVAESVKMAAATGIAGLSIEDFTGDPTAGLYPVADAVARLKAAKDALEGTGIVLTGRAEGFLHGEPDLSAAIRRLQAYAAAGADVLYAPGLSKLEQIEAVVRAVAPKPVNVLVGGALGFGVNELSALGVRRVSTGAALARSAWGGFIRTAKEIAERGSFARFVDAATSAEIVKAFK
jgi:2-methylisocitrate lyase-like PEP mutase family enzyme